MKCSDTTTYQALESATTATPTHTRYLIMLILFLVSTLNDGDRSVLSITGSAIQGGFALIPVQMGWIFSAFAWAYLLGQLHPAQACAR